MGRDAWVGLGMVAAGLLLLAGIGCHSTTVTPPPPALATATVSWAEANAGAAVCPAETNNSCLNGYTVVSDGAVVSAAVPPGTTTWSWQTTAGTHAVVVYDNYVAPSGTVVTVETLATTVTAE